MRGWNVTGARFGGVHVPYPRSADALNGPSRAIVRRASPCLSIEADLREIPLGRTLRDLAGEGAGAPREASLLPYPPRLIYMLRL